MKGKSRLDKTVPEARGATLDEVRKALDALTDEEAERIEQVAKDRINRIGRWAAAGKTYEELIHISCLRFLEGVRNWHPDNVPFVDCFLGTLWSIASEWSSDYKRHSSTAKYPLLESETARVDEEGQLTSTLEKEPNSGLSAEEQLISAEEESESQALLDSIFESFAEDEEATYVLWELEEQKDGPTIWKECGLTEEKFRTIMRRIHRRARKIRNERYGN